MGDRICGEYQNEDFRYAHACSKGLPEAESRAHNHAMYELIYAAGGEAVYAAEGAQYALAAGGLLIIAPTASHRLLQCPVEPFERHVLRVQYAGSTSELAAMLSRILPMNGAVRTGSAYYPPEATAHLAPLFRRMSEISRSPDEDARRLMTHFAHALVAEILLMARAGQPAASSRSTSRTMDALLSYLADNSTRDLSLQEVADAFHLSKDYCNRLFRSATGMTVMQYVLYNRILRARQLLAGGRPSIEVAKAVGYADYSSFYRAYRKVTGRPPSADHEVNPRTT